MSASAAQGAHNETEIDCDSLSFRAVQPVFKCRQSPLGRRSTKPEIS